MTIYYCEVNQEVSFLNFKTRLNIAKLFMLNLIFMIKVFIKQLLHQMKELNATPDGLVEKVHSYISKHILYCRGPATCSVVKCMTYNQEVPSLSHNGSSGF